MKRFSIFGSALMVLAVCAVGSLFAEDRIISTDTEINEAVSYGTSKYSPSNITLNILPPKYSFPCPFLFPFKYSPSYTIHL